MSNKSDKGTVVVVDLTSRTPPYDRRLCEALDEQGEDVELWAAGSYSSDFENISIPRRAGIDIVKQIPWLGKITTKRLKAVEYIINIFTLSLYLFVSRPKVIHLQWLPLLEAFPIVEQAFLRGCRRWGIPVVYTVHDILPLDSGNSYTRSYRWVYHAADALICHTKTARDRLVKDFEVDKSSVHVIPHGPLLDGVSDISIQEARDRLGLPKSDLIALQFGVIRPYKGVDVLLQAWKRVENAVSSTNLIIAGSCEQSYAEELSNLAYRLNLQSVRLDFRFLPEEELRTLIAAADVLVYPYRNITQSGALFAGMNAGKPVIATRVGGFAETVEDCSTGRLVEPEAPDPLADVLIDLFIDSEKRKRLGYKAKERIRDNFSWSAIAEKTIGCYNILIPR